MYRIRCQPAKLWLISLADYRAISQLSWPEQCAILIFDVYLLPH